MSPAFSIAAVAALFLALSAPLALAAWKAAGALPVTAVYALLLSLTAGYQSGLFSRADLPDLNVAEVSGPSVTDAQCAEILSLLDRSGAITERSRPPRLVVVQNLWNQLPQAGQEAVVDCVQRSWPRNAGPAQLEAR